MLLHVFLVLGAWKSVLGKDAVCDVPSYRACVLPDDIRFPETAADIDRMCPQLLQNINCLEDYSKICGPKEYSRRKDLQDLRDVAEEVCRKNSPLYKRIVENISCYNEALQNDKEACKKYLDEKADALINHIENIQLEEDVPEDDLWIPYSCLTGSLDDLCFINKFTEICGTDSRDLVLELVGRSGYVERLCPAAKEERLKEFVTFLEVELEEEAILNRIMGKEEN